MIYVSYSTLYTVQGHEIAVHSITHKGPEEWWGKNATIEDWFDEMVGQANIINRLGTISTNFHVRFTTVPWKVLTDKEYIR